MLLTETLVERIEQALMYGSQIPAPMYDAACDALKTLAHRATTQAPAEPRRWPFVESPGEFTNRLLAAWHYFDGDMLAAVRSVLIENPAALAAPTPVEPAKGDRVRVPDGREGTVTVVSPPTRRFHVHIHKGDGGVYHANELTVLAAPTVPPTKKD